MNTDWVEDRVVFESLTGSRVYGLDSPESDYDYRGVCIPPMRYFTGLYEFEQHESKDPDRTIFNIHKFFKLAMNNNPNILELIFVEEKYIKFMAPIWERVIANRLLFLSKKVKHTYCGYAYAQIKRIKSHKKWLLSPPDHKPERHEFGLRDNTFSADDYGMMASLEDKGGIKSLSDDVVQLYMKEKSFRNALKTYQQYEDWKIHRNPKRAELEAKYLFDTKYMGHTFRLLIQGKEILTTGTLNVHLKDEDIKLIQDIKTGKYEYEYLLGLATDMINELDTLYYQSSLQYSPDINAISRLLEDIISDYCSDDEV